MARLARVLRGHSPHLLCVALLCLGLAAPAWAASPTLVPQPGVTAPASIAELARALKNDVNLIYEYVYTNIDYSPPYGLKKGALGTLLDGRGNDFDQAALLVVVLRQAGYTASYVYLAAAMGYSQSSFLATAESGYTLTGNSIQNLNTANLQSALTGYANNLVSYIKANMLKRQYHAERLDRRWLSRDPHQPRRTGDLLWHLLESQGRLFRWSHTASVRPASRGREPLCLYRQ